MTFKPLPSRMRSLASSNKRHQAFTLIELLVVIGIVALLASLILPAVFSAKARARQTQCLSNMKQFGLALQMYTGDHNDYLPPNLDGQNLELGQVWIEGWLGLPGPDCTNTQHLRRSLLGAYLSELKIWRCPAAIPVTIGGVTQLRVRTVSLNCFMGSPIQSPAAKTYRRSSDIISPSPAQAITFVEERADTINDGSFAMQWDFEEQNPVRWTLRDKPAVLHSGRGTFTFADGHVESQRWRDSRTIKASRDDAVMPNNLDVLWMQERATHRETKPRP